MGNNVIKKYIWETEAGACERCRDLDGTEYQNVEEIPDKPHPNCKCNVREVYEAGCDCWTLMDQLEEIRDGANLLMDKVTKEIASIEEIISTYSIMNNNTIARILNDINSLLYPLTTLTTTLAEFWNNYDTMVKANVINADKYYHAKANCEAAQNGILGSAIAKGISDLREYNDDYRNINEKKYSLEESLKDIMEDQTANHEGRNLGRKYPTNSCSDLLKHRIPRGLDKKDW